MCGDLIHGCAHWLLPRAVTAAPLEHAEMLQWERGNWGGGSWINTIGLCSPGPSSLSHLHACQPCSSVIVTMLNVHPVVITTVRTMLLESMSVPVYSSSNRVLCMWTFWLWTLYWFSPFEVLVGPEAGPQKIRAWGPGLEGGIVGKSADFVVESVGTDVGVLGEFLWPRSRRLDIGLNYIISS